MDSRRDDTSDMVFSSINRKKNDFFCQLYYLFCLLIFLEFKTVPCVFVSN